MPTADPSQKRYLRTGRIAVFGGIALLVGLSWSYTVMMPHMDRVMSEMGAAAAGAWSPWSGIEALFTLLMWVVMMVAMMTPSATPMLLMFDRIARSRSASSFPPWSTTAFLLGYVVLWSGFSIAATAVQAALHAFALLSVGMKSVSPLLSGMLLIAAGAYQLSPLKRACLARCRSPLAFLLAEWREGALGAFVMGLRHGAYCIGCCWLLMGLLFVGGVMNLVWIGVLAAFVLLEKALPSAWVASVLGLGLASWGVWLVASA